MNSNVLSLKGETQGAIYFITLNYLRVTQDIFFGYYWYSRWINGIPITVDGYWVPYNEDNEAETTSYWRKKNTYAPLFFRDF